MYNCIRDLSMFRVLDIFLLIVFTSKISYLLFLYGYSSKNNINIPIIILFTDIVRGIAVSYACINYLYIYSHFITFYSINIFVQLKYFYIIAEKNYVLHP